LLYVIVVTPTLLQRTKRIPTPEIRTISRISPINRVVGGYNRLTVVSVNIVMSVDVMFSAKLLNW